MNPSYDLNNVKGPIVLSFVEFKHDILSTLLTTFSTWKAETHEGHGKCTHDNIEWIIILSEDLLIKFETCKCLGNSVLICICKHGNWASTSRDFLEYVVLYRSYRTISSSVINTRQGLIPQDVGLCLLGNENILTFLSSGAFPERKFSQIISLGVCNRSVLYDVFVYTFLGTLLEHALHMQCPQMHIHCRSLLYRKMLILN